jgi:hypothetical protein
MTKKVFISYSHKDEAFRNDLEDHLAMLRRKNIISVWHDRKIIPGENWKGKIDENMESADIVFFLISSSFLASDYCYDIEVKQAIENQLAGKCQIISIIIRPCDWQECEFSQFQAVPKDAKAIDKWDDQDEAWLDAISSIKVHLKEFKIEETHSKVEVDSDVLIINEKTLEWLNDTEISLSNRRVNKVSLDDVFVVPDVEFQNLNKDENLKIKNTKFLLDDDAFYLISGEEQQGKTSLLKYFFKALLKLEKIPIYIDASKVKRSDLKYVISKSASEQYESLDVDEYMRSSNSFLLIDNIDRLQINDKYRAIFLDGVNSISSKVIVTCHSTFSYIYNEISELDNYEAGKLLGFGHKSREEIVKKWLSLGQVENISDLELYEQCDDIKVRLNIIIKRNVVPPKPIYILMLLQMFEANTQLNTELTSYGHCYQQLIYQTFENAHIKRTDFEKYLNVLSELSWWILTNGKNPNNHELNSFFDGYCEKYLPVNREEVIEKLVRHSILKIKGFETGFKYPYIYYFFAGKRVAESYQEHKAVRDEVEVLLSSLHREDYANILIFITHHTKDLWVLNEIKKVLASLFSENNEATLYKSQLFFMEDFMRKIPDLVIELRVIQKERDSHNEKLDLIERDQRVEGLEFSGNDSAKRFGEDDFDQVTEPADILAIINKTFKGMEIAGQIIRNRHASLTTESMINLASSGMASGLRFLEYFINISDVAKNEIVKLIANHLSEQPDLSDHEIEKGAENAYMHLTYGVVSGVLRKIALSVGSKEALSIYEEVEKKKGTPASSLIRFSIDLQFNKRLNMDTVANSVREFKDNAVCMRILKEIVIEHIYMFPVDYQDKQKLSNILNLSMKGQRLMDHKRAIKG